MCPAWSTCLGFRPHAHLHLLKMEPSLPFSLMSLFPSMTVPLLLRKEFFTSSACSMLLFPYLRHPPPQQALPWLSDVVWDLQALCPVPPTPGLAYAAPRSSHQPALLTDPVLCSCPPMASSQTLKAHWALSLPCRGHAVAAQASRGPVRAGSSCFLRTPRPTASRLLAGAVLQLGAFHPLLLWIWVLPGYSGCTLPVAIPRVPQHVPWFHLNKIYLSVYWLSCSQL